MAAYLRVSQQRGAQMYAEGKFPEPDEIDGIGPLWKPNQEPGEPPVEEQGGRAEQREDDANRDRIHTGIIRLEPSP